MTKRNLKSNNSLLETTLFLSGLFALWWAVQNQNVALFLLQNPHLILPYLIQEFGLFWLAIGAVGILALFWLLIAISTSNSSNVLRGAKLVSSGKLKSILQQQPKLRNQPQLKIAGMPIPSAYENRGFFVVGSPGSGKTKAIEQLVANLKQRTDFRGIVFDRGGELLEKF